MDSHHYLKKFFPEVIPPEFGYAHMTSLDPSVFPNLIHNNNFFIQHYDFSNPATSNLAKKRLNEKLRAMETKKLEEKKKQINEREWEGWVSDSEDKEDDKLIGIKR